MIRTGTYECTIGDLADDFDYLLNIPHPSGYQFSNRLQKEIKCEGKSAKGFTIGKHGKTMFWYINPTQNGCYKCHPVDEQGNIYEPRYYDPRTKITIHYQ